MGRGRSGMGRTCCAEWTVKHGTILVGSFTLIASFFWLAWQAYDIIWIDNVITEAGDVCDPNPCERGGSCIASNVPTNSLGYVCDCSGVVTTSGTPYLGYHCNITQTRMRVKRSCGDWFKDGYRENNTYMVDPDGHNPGDPDELEPVSLRCNFTSTRAYTIMDHDVDIRREMKNYSDGFTQSVDYRLDLDRHISYIKDRAKTCEQSFTFQCKEYPLYEYNERDNNEDPLDQITDDNEQSHLIYGDTTAQKMDFAGNLLPRNPANCQCKEDGNCDTSETSAAQDSQGLCNCDIKDTEIRSDSITFTTDDGSLNDRFPITGIFIAPYSEKTDTDDVEDTYFWLSPLICYEEFREMETIEPEREIFTSKQRSGLRIIWGVMISLMVITVIMILCAIILLMGVAMDACHALLPWMVIILIYNIMVFIAVVVRWFYFGYYWVVWEVAVVICWMGITFYGMVVVGMHYSDCLNTRVQHM